MFGWENLGQKSVEEAHKAVIEGIEKLKPLLDFVEDQGAGILHGLFDRLDGVTITIHIPKAGADWQKTPP